MIIFQGAITYYMVYRGSSAQSGLPVPWMGMAISSFLFGGFYPLTQIYQHGQDLRDGVRTLSYKLGYMGTFIFTGIMYVAAEILLFIYFSTKGRQDQFVVLQFFFLPIVTYFFFWWRKVYQSRANANFHYCMRMNMIAAVCTNTAFMGLYFGAVAE